MRGSNSYLKRTRLVASSKKVTINISPNQPLFTPWCCQCESASIDGTLCLIFSQRWDFPRAEAHKGLFFFLCTGSLLAAHSQYPLIKPVTLSLTVTLKKYTKVTLCFREQGCTSTLFICYALNCRPFAVWPMRQRFLFYLEARSTLMSWRCLSSSTSVVRKVGEVFFFY